MTTANPSPEQKIISFNEKQVTIHLSDVPLNVGHTRSTRHASDSEVGLVQVLISSVHAAVVSLGMVH